jgi:hypothetical protein
MLNSVTVVPVRLYTVCGPRRVEELFPKTLVLIISLLNHLISGAPFQWAAIFHKDDIRFVNGVSGLRFYKSGEKVAEHSLPCKVSCAYCGSLIMDEGRNMLLIFPGLIDFKTEDKRRKFAAK